MDTMDDWQFIFGALLVVANRMDTLLERELSHYDITAKQWMLSIVIENRFNKPPTIKEVAKEMGSSHQNIKQLALKLAEKKLLVLEKDSKDARVTRLRLTKASQVFWEQTQGSALAFSQALFQNTKEEELTKTRSLLSKLLLNLEIMEAENVSGKEVN